MSIAQMLWTKVIVVALRKCDVRCRSYEGIAGVAEAEVPVIAKSSQPPKRTSPFHFTSRVIHPRPCTQRLVVARWHVPRHALASADIRFDAGLTRSR
jgi:hypothetical protein